MEFSFFGRCPKNCSIARKKYYFARLWGLQPPPSSYAYAYEDRKGARQRMGRSPGKGQPLRNEVAREQLLKQQATMHTLSPAVTSKSTFFVESSFSTVPNTEVSFALTSSSRFMSSRGVWEGRSLRRLGNCVRSCQRRLGERLTGSEVLQCSGQPVLRVLLQQLLVCLRDTVAHSVLTEKTHDSHVAGVSVTQQ